MYNVYVLIMAAFFILWPAVSFADWDNKNSHSNNASNDSGHHDNNHHDSDHHDSGHHDKGKHHSSIDFNFVVSPDYYYTPPAYYPPPNDAYFQAPVDEPVDGPVDQEPISIIPPTTVVPIEPVEVPGTSTPDSFTINIPNDKGGYTPVIIRKSGNGYIGPQGEYYPYFPKVSQLIVMYGKS